jgi:hypothetical protein
MPPTGALPEADVKAIQAWINSGAPYPDSHPSSFIVPPSQKWWAFRPLQRPAVPAIKDPWIKNPVDAFLLEKMRAEGVRPNPPADRATLIRRATFDLHGLPPTPEEIRAFVNDRSPNAWEKVVDGLLASPRYGERWARHWLDLARFAESEGFKADETRPNAWRYRDYVIRSLNEDKPYDRFMKEQIAGDEIAPHDPEALVATGFNRHWADESNARNIPLRRQEILNDITDTVGSVFLGLTVGCARCHDHKYDPVSQKDYYRLQAFFAAAQPRDNLPLVSAAEMERHRRQMAEWEQGTKETRARLEALETPVRERLARGKRMPFPQEVQDAIDTPAARRTALQWQLFLKVSPQLAVSEDEVGKAMDAAARTSWEALRAGLAKAAPSKPSPLPLGIGVTDVGRDAPKVFTLAVGVYDQPVEEVQPGFLSAVTSRPPSITPPAGMASTGRRTALAGWLGSPENPLPARVMVNRLWQFHFGKGLAASASDFGKTGDAPTHPELLDWLASCFATGDGGRETDDRNGRSPVPGLRSPEGHAVSRPAKPWSLKAMHRLMMTSAAYCQSSAFNPLSAEKDRENRLLWQYRRWRLEGEALRDACLSASGELNGKMFGPSVFPELPQGVETRGGWTLTADEKERNRRSIYVFVRRNLRYPLFEAFDFPDTHESCARRNRTNTAPQALILLNGELPLKWARAMAGRLLREAPTDEARVERAYALAFAREPEGEERAEALAFLKRQAEIIRARLERKEPVGPPIGAPEGTDPAEGAALADFCHALMNANEFLYVD